MDKEYAFETKHKAEYYKKMQKKMLDRAIQEHKKGNMLLEKDYLALAEQYAKGYSYEKSKK